MNNQLKNRKAFLGYKLVPGESLRKGQGHRRRGFGKAKLVG
jgi:hypothetical protein